MKCCNCKSDYHEVVIDHMNDIYGIYDVSQCPVCDEYNSKLIKKHKKGHWNHAKVQNNIAILLTILFELGITQMIITHQEFFFTT